MNSYVLGFRETDKAKLVMTGGKGAKLSELCRIQGINVPEGFCITTEAYKEVVGNSREVNSLLDQLSRLGPAAGERIFEICKKLRKAIEQSAVPEKIKDEIKGYLKQTGEFDAYAIRSSATSEDLPTASFAGQHDTYLNIIGTDEILRHISKCWASLFTGRAAIYRLQNNFDHKQISLSVVVQKMVFPQASGILFTADPVTSNRKLLSIDAGFGLGEALVSGLVTPDRYKVREEKIVEKIISEKKLAVYGLTEGGTETKQVKPDQQRTQCLSDKQILQLSRLARQIEAHFGCPQDIEWSLADDTFYFLQSRPVTALYPVPEAADQEYHVYISVGHQQMMTDPIKPLGLSFFLLTTRAPMYNAGGRLFVDVTDMLASPERRKVLLDNMGQHDRLIKDALMTIIERGDSLNSRTDNKNEHGQISKGIQAAGNRTQIESDPGIVSDLIKKSQDSIEKLKQNIRTKSGSGLFDFITEDILLLKEELFDPQKMRVIMAAMDASSWINKKLNDWLSEINAADTLSQSVPDNITSEMGRALLDVADVIRPYPEIIEYLQHENDDDFLDKLNKFNGGQESRGAIAAFLNKYGMRCAGEIDITRTRWSEQPATLLPLILSNIKNFKPGAGKRKFEQGRQEALKKEEEVLARLWQLPDGDRKANETKQMIGLLRNFSGYREYPKYVMVNRYFVYKQALLKEAGKLLKAGVIYETEDIYYLTFEELRETVHTQKLDYKIISKRKEEYRIYEKLTPPRVITSDGEIIAGKYNRENLPSGAIAGLAVSSGLIEGRARIILKIEEAEIEDGDILVTTFTDPGWTPLFVSIKGLVTEVGGLMTHGAVIAREYGLPAVVGVENATRLIKDGQRIRVNGTEGYVDIL